MFLLFNLFIFSCASSERLQKKWKRAVGITNVSFPYTIHSNLNPTFSHLFGSWFRFPVSQFRNVFVPDKLIHFFIVFLFKVRSTVMKTSKDYFCMPQIAACNFIPLLFLASIALLLHVICSIAQRDPAGPQDSLLRAHIFKTSRCHELYRDFA